MKYLEVAIVALSWLTLSSAIISKGGKNEIAEKSSEETKKADQIDAQSSHTHSVYEGKYSIHWLNWALLCKVNCKIKVSD